MSKVLIQMLFETHMSSNITDPLRYLGAFSESSLAQIEKSILKDEPTYNHLGRNNTN
jgi:hypothetical protein